MASCQWNGDHAKSKSKQEAKAMFMHNDKEQRKLHTHTNPHVGASPDDFNFNYHGLDYKGMCDAFDARLSEVDFGRQSRGKNARTLMQSIIVYAPLELTNDDLISAWYHDVGALLDERYGENFIEMSVHFDEVHTYTEPITQKKLKSRVHAHCNIIPEVKGKLNGKLFSSRKEINELNEVIEEMTMGKYHVHFLDGSKKKGGKSVEELKAESDKASSVLTYAQEEAERVRQQAQQEAERMRQQAQSDADAIREEALQDAADEKEVFVQAKADFEKDKAELEAAKVALEKDKSKLETEKSVFEKNKEDLESERDALRQTKKEYLVACESIELSKTRLDGLILQIETAPSDEIFDKVRSNCIFRYKDNKTGAIKECPAGVYEKVQRERKATAIKNMRDRALPKVSMPDEKPRSADYSFGG